MIQIICSKNNNANKYQGEKLESAIYLQIFYLFKQYHKMKKVVVFRRQLNAI